MARRLLVAGLLAACWAGIGVALVASALMRRLS